MLLLIFNGCKSKVFRSRPKDALPEFNMILIMLRQSYDGNATKRDVLFFN